MQRAAGAQRPVIVVASGLCAGALATILAAALSARTAPLSLLVILVSTLLAGRLAPIGPALAHGACAWMVLAIAGLVAHRVNLAWHGIPALWPTLLLVEDMALIGRAGYLRQLIVRRNRTSP